MGVVADIPTKNQTGTAADHRRRLERDLEQYVENGELTETAADELRANAAEDIDKFYDTLSALGIPREDVAAGLRDQEYVTGLLKGMARTAASANQDAIADALEPGNTYGDEDITDAVVHLEQ